MTSIDNTTITSQQNEWDRLARRASLRRKLALWLVGVFLLFVSLPVLLPYFWMLTISVSAKTGGVDSVVLWKSCIVVAPALFGMAVWFNLINSRRNRILGLVVIFVIATIVLLFLIGPDLHLENYRFLWNPNIVEEIRGRSGAGGDQFPWVWNAFANSLVFAIFNTILVLYVSTLAGYYVSRFGFKGRATFLQALLVLHAFPAMTLIIPIFLIMHWIGMLDTISGVVVVVVTLELPFSIFIMKGFFDGVPWDIEMSAMSDGASRRQAFWHVVLPQVKVGMLAVGVFAFIKGWEEYVFVRTLLFEKSNWMMSLYLFWVSDDIMGVDYGIVAAVSVFYILPSLLLYIFCQKYLVQMSLGGIKG